jgi:hypothetical protein
MKSDWNLFRFYLTAQEGQAGPFTVFSLELMLTPSNSGSQSLIRTHTVHLTNNNNAEMVNKKNDTIQKTRKNWFPP